MPADTQGSLRSLREMNRLRTLEAVREGGHVSRADIARSTGLARSTVSTLVAELQEAGLVVEEDRASVSRGGRPPAMLTLNPAAGRVIGIHFDHPYVRVAVADLQHTILAEASRALPTDEAAKDALDAAGELAEQVLAEAGVARNSVLGAGAAVAGPIDRDSGLVAPSGVLPGWRGIDVQSELEQRLRTPVHIENDANLG